MKPDLAPDYLGPAPEPGAVGALEQALGLVNRVAMLISTMALLAAAFILTESVFVRYFLRQTTDWQDEYSVILLVGAVFLSAAHVQSVRGHIGIEALDAILPASINRARKKSVDAASVAFCGFFAWKSWSLTQEAWLGGETTTSTIGTPLWIPYAIMATGMSLLCLQIAQQLFFARQGRPER